MRDNQTLANDRIKSPTVRLILEDGTNKGVISTREALNQARQAGLDLVAINTQADPMIVKILDYNKWRYEQKRAEKDKARRDRENEIQQKEIQLRPVTDQHDLEIKARMAREFLDDNCRVKVVIKFRGREMAFKDLGFQILDRFMEILGEARKEKDASLMGNRITLMLLPVKKDKP